MAPPAVQVLQLLRHLRPLCVLHTYADGTCRAAAAAGDHALDLRAALRWAAPTADGWTTFSVDPEGTLLRGPRPPELPRQLVIAIARRARSLPVTVLHHGVLLQVTWADFVAHADPVAAADFLPGGPWSRTQLTDRMLSSLESGPRK